MRTGFVSRIGPYRVERLSGVQRTFSSIDTSKPPTGGGHTTEGSWDSALAVFRARLTAPHTMVEGKRIGQGVPFGEMAASFENDPGGVETNRWCRHQIEVVENSEQTLWLPNKDTVETLAHIILWSKENLGIPMTRPFDSDDLGPTPWATEDYHRRHAGKWGVEAGWFMHVEIPENAHWDMGMYRWSVQMKMAHDLAQGVPRTLRLTHPHMSGTDVVSAKKLLRENRWGDFGVGNVLPSWGMEAAQATNRAKFWLGYPKDEVNPNFGPLLREMLDSGHLEPKFRARRLARLTKVGGSQPIFTSSRAVH